MTEPFDIDAYLAKRDTLRARVADRLLTGFTEREQALMREAAVMGWVQGMRHHDLPVPKNTPILRTVLDACLAFQDLYPTITGYVPGED